MIWLFALLAFIEISFAEVFTPEMLKNTEADARNFNGYQNVEVVKKFLQDKKACDIAIGFSPHNRASDLVPPVIWCITEMTYAKGTINEVEGCAFTHFNLKNGEYDIPGYLAANGMGKPVIAKGKACDTSGIAALLDTDIYDTYKPVKVRDYMAGNSLMTSTAYPIILLNSSNEVATAIGKARDVLDAEYVQAKVVNGLRKLNKK